MCLMMLPVTGEIAADHDKDLKLTVAVMMKHITTSALVGSA